MMRTHRERKKIQQRRGEQQQKERMLDKMMKGELIIISL